MFDSRAPDTLSITSRLLYYAAIKRGISVTTFDDPHLLRMEYAGHSWYTRGSRSSFQSSVGFTIAGDKYLSKQVLARAGMPVPTARQIERRDKEQRAEVLSDLPLPVVVKPARDTSSGEDVFVNITERSELHALTDTLLSRHEALLVETQLVGADHRVLVIGGEACAAMKRVPANVTGDGTRSIRDLIAIKNMDPLRGDGYENILTRIEPDDEMLRFLAQSHRDLETVPAADELVILRGVSNVGKGGDVINVTDELSEQNKRTFETIASLVDCDPVAIDFMGTDLSTDIRTQERGGIVEINASPGFGYGSEFTWLAERTAESLLAKVVASHDSPGCATMSEV